MSGDFTALQEATAGAVGSLVSTSVLYPLDTCKTRFQAEARAGTKRRFVSTYDVFRQALDKGQFLSLYQGIGTKNFQSFVSGFVYFYSYQYIKRWYLGWSNTKSMGTGANLLVAAAAGVCNCLIIQPLDTASSRMQTSDAGRAKGLWATLTEGTWKEAYDGLGASLLLTCNPAIQYTVFEQLRTSILATRMRVRHDARKAAAITAHAAGKTGSAVTSAMNKAGGAPPALSALGAFALGALAKTIATVITYPLIRAKVILQAAPHEDEDPLLRPKRVMQVLDHVYQHEGLLGFYKGLEAQVLKTVLAAALMLMIKEKVNQGTGLALLLVQQWSRTGKKGARVAPIPLNAMK